ncbi:methylase involved in ubiquinone/menaquinone biosynthesis [Cenarchaeum symbiosum A]|uniref:Methylase involved in ubiquinone/menaquinone biosynthesis n=1 Tax=Cenarchaeum symbiosum (strain A) TaxID=414004 RepID=A0RU04_CENSY|nr:methylase involved in ubiquinone/menaquinone biosynthesis [Cenarchaeum symbiosum A]
MGLAGYWPEVLNVLREIIPVYDRVNSYISLGRDTVHRRRGITGRISPGDKVLDAGSGFGNMSGTALDICGDLDVTMCDPLLPMLKKTNQDTPRALSCGVFEHMPFRTGGFDAVLCGYSLRDAISLKTAISELHRVLKDGGRLVIVDLGKPDCIVYRAGVSIYLRLVLPIIALIAGGRLGLKFATLYGTFQRWPRNKKLEEMLLEKFSRVEFEKDLKGGAIMVAAYK